MLFLGERYNAQQSKGIRRPIASFHSEPFTTTTFSFPTPGGYENVRDVLDELVIAANHSELDTSQARTGFETSLFKKLAAKNEERTTAAPLQFQDRLRQIVALAAIEQWKADKFTAGEKLRSAKNEPAGKKNEVAANVGIMVVAIVVCVAAVRYFRTKASGSQAPTPAIAAGTKINLPDEDGARNRQTLLRALSTNCKYCSASAGFYQRLMNTASSNTKLVAVLPQTRAECYQYLKNLKATIEDIQQVSPNSLGVRGTPTLILVNGEGTVTKSWVGQLSADKEQEVLSALR